jgi:hypothetical protein
MEKILNEIFEFSREIFERLEKSVELLEWMLVFRIQMIKEGVLLTIFRSKVFFR